MSFNWFCLVFQWKGSVIPAIIPRVLLFTFIAFFICLWHNYQPDFSFALFDDLATNIVYNLILGLLLVFRTNTAYERYWEGRKAWGAITINISNLAQSIGILILEKEIYDKENKIKALKMLAAMGITTKLYLRQQTITNELENIVNPEDIVRFSQAKNPPLEVILSLRNYLQQECEKEHLNTYMLLQMNILINEIVSGVTNCERILTTPIPIAYAIYLKRLIMIYCLSIPFSFVTDIGWLTPIFVMFISFILLSIEEIGNEIEDPFGMDDNDLPIDNICQTIIDNIERTISYISTK